MNEADRYAQQLQCYDNLDKARAQAVEAQVAAAYKVEELQCQRGEFQQFEVDNWVMVRNMKKQKFDANFYGPFHVQQQGPFYTYKLAFPDGMELTEMIHNEQLQRAEVGELVPKKLWSKASIGIKKKAILSKDADDEVSHPEISGE
ncbi:hypothetical protein FBU31_001608 [Coemansia sp. 'formosensis']|nr:hypothetical protein FBU31_001608 [Coemansia sp. 'formosensis']